MKRFDKMEGVNLRVMPRVTTKTTVESVARTAQEHEAVMGTTHWKG